MSQTAQVPAELLDRVVAYFHPRRVILFGSQARGEAGPDSDFDLLVILDDDAPADRLTLRAGWESRQGFDRAADVIPVRNRVYQRRAKIVGTLSYEAEIDGAAVYESVGSDHSADAEPPPQAAAD
jgi:predicted nucleotidyltransferase